jgi:tetratricopeptide (TPR) repeat protein
MNIHNTSNSLKETLNEGNQLKSKGQLEQAIQKYNEALQIKSDCCPALMHLAEIYERKDNFKKAIFYYKSVINLKPNNSMAISKLGRLMIKVGDKQGAINVYRKAILENHPKWVYEGFKDVLDTNDDFNFYFDLGVEFTIKGHVSEAVNLFVKAIKAQPTFLPSFVKLLALQNQSKIDVEDWISLISCYKDTIENLQKSIHFAHINLGIALTELGKVNEAIACNKIGLYHKLLESQPDFFTNSWELGCSRKPNFLIIGAPKCGTSSLYSYTIEHPSVISPLLKEVNFFNKNYIKGVDWYLSHFAPLPKEKYLTGEATPLYLYDFDAPQRVYDLFPDIKLIIILRNPVDRAVSAYYHRARNKKLKASFEEVFDTRISEFNEVTDILDNENYLMNKNDIIWQGMYFQFVEKWMNIFQKEKVLVLRNEDLLENPKIVMQKVFEFLDLPSYESSSYVKKNVGSYSSIHDSVRQDFSRIYHYHNERLEEYLGIKLNW